MKRKATELVVLGEGPVACVMGSILKAPIVARNAQDTGWNWPKLNLAERVKLVFVSSGREGVDRIIRLHSEAWLCPKVARIGVMILVPETAICQSLVDRDVFGRMGETDARFADYPDVLGVVSGDVSLEGMISCLANLGHLPVDTWHREACNASCIPALLDAVKACDGKQLLGLLPKADAVHWDSICFPYGEFVNGHAYANAVDRWIKSVTLGVTPDWELGIKLLSPLATR